MKDLYADHGRKLGGFPCVTIKTWDDLHRVWEYDDVLAGQMGEIWQFGADTFKALSVTKDGQNEKITSLKLKDISKWRNSLNVPFIPANQVAYANNPDRRLKS